MRLLHCIELDPRTFMLTVCECHSERRWFWTFEHEQQRSYTLSVGVGRWHDGDRYVLQPDPRHFRLWELFGSWRLERKLDTFVELSAPVLFQLPPVPVFRAQRVTAHCR